MKVSVKNKKLFYIMLILFCLSVLYFYKNNPATSKYPTCPFLYITGYYCPGCGSSRAYYNLMHGRIKDAFSLNPLMVLSIPFVIYYCIGEIGIYVNDRPIIRRTVISKKGYKIIFFIIVLYWILRNIPYYPFILLAP
ncbi:DUF2752 domain-containing protein [Thermobrachium celere]|uniref:DUF2752 domain-containing protein n=1 Tax=Thermobrachium celere DSM 8682 TaxID=941824 RepID=R7RQ18_9CLOT|nr:DUF2752 domain-containing protein [Thermobrachium celere]CDF57446.1 hypothetical protein TCEL_01360 [Thermobrachium celere DSM 8682]